MFATQRRSNRPVRARGQKSHARFTRVVGARGTVLLSNSHIARLPFGVVLLAAFAQLRLLLSNDSRRST